MFSIGIMLLFFGYANIYTGVANLRNGGQGPTLRESLGFKTALAPPGSDVPNLTGQPAQPPGNSSATGQLHPFVYRQERL